MSNPPRPKSRRAATAASLIVVLMVVGGAAYAYSHPAPATSTTTTQSASAQNGTRYLQDGTIPLDGFISDAVSNYVSDYAVSVGNYLGVSDQCTSTQVFNETVTGSPVGDLYVQSGSILICPFEGGLKFTFSGTASANVTYAGGRYAGTVYDLTLGFVPIAAALPARTVTVTTTPPSLNATFMDALPTVVSGLVESAVQSSGNATVQAQNLAKSLSESTSPVVQSYLAAFPQGASYAAAYLLAGATSGTSFFSSVFSQLEAEFR